MSLLHLPPAASTDTFDAFQKPFIISKERLLSQYFSGEKDRRDFKICSMLPDGSCYAPASHQNNKFFLFHSRLAYIKHFLSHYFSDENLKYDNYLTQKMNSQGFISTKILLEFPRLSSINVNIDELIKAIRQHPLLNLSTNKKPNLYPMVGRKDRYPNRKLKENYSTLLPPPASLIMPTFYCPIYNQAMINQIPPDHGTSQAQFFYYQPQVIYGNFNEIKNNTQKVHVPSNYNRKYYNEFVNYPNEFKRKNYTKERNHIPDTNLKNNFSFSGRSSSSGIGSECSNTNYKTFNFLTPI